MKVLNGMTCSERSYMKNLHPCETICIRTKRFCSKKIPKRAGIRTVFHVGCNQRAFLQKKSDIVIIEFSQRKLVIISSDFCSSFVGFVEKKRLLLHGLGILTKDSVASTCFRRT